MLTAALVAATAAAAACAVYTPLPAPPSSRVAAEVALFWDDLAPFGDWVWMEVHGWVWVPRGTPAGWRPYTHGRWVYTSHGWTWVSDWRWGWAPFHYGRWLWNRDLGWVWIPGDEWAPAWVAWRHGPGWVGWAPLPPGVHWEIGIGFDLGSVTFDLGWWSFVHSEHFTDHRLTHRILPGDRGPDLERITREVTRYERMERGVVERSVPLDAVEPGSLRPVLRLRIEELSRPPRKVERIDGDRLRVYRPEVAAGGQAGPRPPRSKRPLHDGDRRGEDRPRKPRGGP